MKYETLAEVPLHKLKAMPEQARRYTRLIDADLSMQHWYDEQGHVKIGKRETASFVAITVGDLVNLSDAQKFHLACRLNMNLGELIDAINTYAEANGFPPYDDLTFDGYAKLEDVPVFELEGVSVRAKNALVSAPYYSGVDVKTETVGDIIGMGALTLLRIPNFGKKSLDEIREAIRKVATKHGFAIPDGLLEVSK